MSRGPEANFWNNLRQNLPEKCLATRIENVHGGGVPDVHILWNGYPLWIELKVAKSSRLFLRPHQVAFHMAYYARGGLSFFLAKALSTGDLHLFGGDQGPVLAQGPMSEALGTRYGSAREMFLGLGPVVEDHYRGLVGRSCGLSGV